MSLQALTSFSDGESQVQLSKFCVKRKGTLRKELIFIEQLPVYLLIEILPKVPCAYTILSSFFFFTQGNFSSERLICPGQNTWRTCAVSLCHIILSHLIKSLCFHCLLSARTLPNQFLMKSRSWHLYVLHPGLLAQRCQFRQHSLHLSPVRPGLPLSELNPKGLA